MEKSGKPGIRKRSPVVSGIFYPEYKAALIEMLRFWRLKNNFSITGGQAIIVPHGAWDLTGNISASAFKYIQKESGEQNLKRVLLFGTCHESGENALEEGIYLSESDFFETPLGNLAVDKEFNKKLSLCSALIMTNDIPHLSEHSLEVILPIVKYCLPNVPIVPILMNSEKETCIYSLAKALKISMETFMEECLIIITSTVSQNSDPAVASSMADEFSSLLEDMNSQVFLERLKERRISACGGALIAAILESGLLSSKHFSALHGMVKGRGENGETVYYGAFGA